MIDIKKAINFEVDEYKKDCDCRMYYEPNDWGMKLWPVHLDVIERCLRLKEYRNDTNKIVAEMKKET